MNINAKRSKQSGAALIVALVALLVLTLLGVRTMGDVMNQSSVVRNEQFKQKVFYAAVSETNVQINEVNDNPQNEDDAIINSLQETGSNGKDMKLGIAAGNAHELFTNPEGVNLIGTEIRGERADSGIGCFGESIGKVKQIAGEIQTTASLDDGRVNNIGSIRSTQRQRYVYCWP